MKRSFSTVAWFAAALGAAILQPSMIGSASADDAETVKQIFAQQLPNVPGNSMTAFVVEYAPGGKSTSHHHSGSVSRARRRDIVKRATLTAPDEAK